ncbi:hypothetical protein B0H14DRAFT_3478895 [Mycena olivaceomarginata]|nr:hypothetical protein B0H14DRAFT_3478895 [Mycena olivaceomarginata]
MSHSSTSTPAKMRPRRKAFPSARIANSNNMEPSTADQQQALDTMKVLTLIKKVEALAILLPESVLEASDGDNELHRVLTDTTSINNFVAVRTIAPVWSLQLVLSDSSLDGESS